MRLRWSEPYITGADFPHLSSNSTSDTMQPAFAKLLSVCIVAVLVGGFLVMAEATYRKPPFNGSIFGKRGVTNEYDSASKALSAMCEIASEACQTWFPAQEK